MEDASDLSDADKNSLMDESDDSGIIPGSHSENELHGGDDPDDDASKSQGYSPAPKISPALPLPPQHPGSGPEAPWLQATTS